MTTAIPAYQRYASFTTDSLELAETWARYAATTFFDSSWLPQALAGDSAAIQKVRHALALINQKINGDALLQALTTPFTVDQFKVVSRIRPARDSSVRTRIERLHLTFDMRLAVLQVLIASAYRTVPIQPYTSLVEASAATRHMQKVFGAIEPLLQECRLMLRAEWELTKAALAHLRQNIQTLEVEAERKMGMITTLLWYDKLGRMERYVKTALVGRAQLLTGLAFPATPAQSAVSSQTTSHRWHGLGVKLLRHAPGLAMFALGVAAVSMGVVYMGWNPVIVQAPPAVVTPVAVTTTVTSPAEPESLVATASTEWHILTAPQQVMVLHTQADVTTLQQAGHLLPATGEFPLYVTLTQQSQTVIVERVDTAATLITTYGQMVYASPEEMPPALRQYFMDSTSSIAAHFNVDVRLLWAINKAENNGVGLRVHQTAVSSARATGVYQIVPRTWNGWARTDNHNSHERNMRLILQYGGIGYDWSRRADIEAVRRGELPASVLNTTDADPLNFEDSSAAAAIHFVQYRVTLDQQNVPEYAQRLADATAIYNAGRPLAISADFVQSDANPKTTGGYVAEVVGDVGNPVTGLSASNPVLAVESYRHEFVTQFDRTFGMTLTSAEVDTVLEVYGHQYETAVRAATQRPDDAALALMRDLTAAYIATNISKRALGEPLMFPYIYDAKTQAIQSYAITYTGRVLSEVTLEALMTASGGDIEVARQMLQTHPDTQIYQMASEMLKTARSNTAVRPSEVSQMVQIVTAGYTREALRDPAIQQVITDDLHRTVFGTGASTSQSRFAYTPLIPMPALTKAFGVVVDYQAGGVHTGIDIAAPRTPNGQEPLIYTVSDGTVAHVGALYCNKPNACRGGNAIVIDHGDNVYTVYSHNSTADVHVGQWVQGGQPIGRQGNEGYSFGSHLHFEVHVGAPWSGNWETPFEGGRFVDPMKELPK